MFNLYVAISAQEIHALGMTSLDLTTLWVGNVRHAECAANMRWHLEELGVRGVGEIKMKHRGQESQGYSTAAFIHFSNERFAAIAMQKIHRYRPTDDDEAWRVNYANTTVKIGWGADGKGGRPASSSSSSGNVQPVVPPWRQTPSWQSAAAPPAQAAPGPPAKRQPKPPGVPPPTHCLLQRPVLVPPLAADPGRLNRETAIQRLRSHCKLHNWTVAMGLTDSGSGDSGGLHTRGSGGDPATGLHHGGSGGDLAAGLDHGSFGAARPSGLHQGAHSKGLHHGQAGHHLDHTGGHGTSGLQPGCSGGHGAPVLYQGGSRGEWAAELHHGGSGGDVAAEDITTKKAAEASVQHEFTREAEDVEEQDFDKEAAEASKQPDFAEEAAKAEQQDFVEKAAEASEQQGFDEEAAEVEEQDSDEEAAEVSELQDLGKDEAADASKQQDFAKDEATVASEQQDFAEDEASEVRMGRKRTRADGSVPPRSNNRRRHHERAEREVIHNLAELYAEPSIDDMLVALADAECVSSPVHECDGSD